MEYKSEREDVAYFMRRLYTQNLTTCSGGNISYKINNNIMLITPSGLDKGRITAEQIGMISFKGENLTPELKPSIETEMHLETYKKREDIRAVVHAHPSIASSFTASEKRINTSLIAESISVVGEPVFAHYGMMGTKELAQIVSRATLQGNTVLMANHGVLTVGESLLQAFDRIEVLEAAAKITLITELLGDKKELTKTQLSELKSKIGSKPEIDEELIKIISKAVIDNLF